jgi:small GTP-binding protein
MALDDEQYDYLFKLVIVGDSAVGKSNLLTRFTRDEYNAAAKATIGVDFGSKSTKTADGKIIKAQIWDTAGQERFRATTNGFYRGALGAMIVFDITNRKTFESVSTWLKELRQMAADPEPVVMLVGNKADLASNRQVTTSEAKTFAEDNDMFFFETSALTASNVTTAFETLLNEIYKAMNRKSEPAPTPKKAASKRPDPQPQPDPEPEPPRNNNTIRITNPEPDEGAHGSGGGGCRC